MRVTSTDIARVSMQIDDPVYRVNFWEILQPGFGWVLDAYLLDESSDVTEVLLWALENSRGRRFEVFIHGEQTDESSSLIRLYGDNPNAAPERSTMLFAHDYLRSGKAE